jgi:hypothetical protein
MTGFFVTGFFTQKCDFIKIIPSCFSNKWYTHFSSVSTKPHVIHSYHRLGSLAGASCEFDWSILSMICNTWSHVVARGQAIQTIFNKYNLLKWWQLSASLTFEFHAKFGHLACCTSPLGIWSLDVRPVSSVLWAGEVLSRRRPPL